MILEEFEIIIAAIRKLMEETNGLASALKDYFDGHVVCTIGDDSIIKIIHAVERTVTTKPLHKHGNGVWSDVEWFLWETDCGQRNTEVTYPDASTKNIVTVEDLFNHLMEQRND